MKLSDHLPSLHRCEPDLGSRTRGSALLAALAVTLGMLPVAAAQPAPDVAIASLVREALADPWRPPPELLRRENAALEVLRQMGPEHRDAQSGHLRVLAWLGDRRGISPVEKLLEARAVD